MANKKVVRLKKGAINTVKGTGSCRYGFGSVAPSMSTITRQPLAVPMDKAKGQADPKSAFILNLLMQAGAKGVTWPELQAALKAKYGSAPMKRYCLYMVLKDRQHYTATGSKGVKTYYLGRPPKVRSKAKSK